MLMYIVFFSEKIAIKTEFDLAVFLALRATKRCCSAFFHEFSLFFESNLACSSIQSYFRVTLHFARILFVIYEVNIFYTCVQTYIHSSFKGKLSQSEPYFLFQPTLY